MTEVGKSSVEFENNCPHQRQKHPIRRTGTFHAENCRHLKKQQKVFYLYIISVNEGLFIQKTTII